jgi:hypothetical protein
MKRLFILAASAVVLFACSNDKADEAKTTESTASATSEKDKKLQAAEFADAKYVDWGKKMNTQFSSGDIDGWITNFADNAKFRWSAGDSLDGKQAITNYWKNRRMNVIDSIQFTDEIWLPVKVNTAQTTHDMPGVWLLSWYTVHARYKNGQRLMFGVHVDYHYDANDKIDQIIQYIDRAPINAAVAKK